MTVTIRKLTHHPELIYSSMCPPSKKKKTPLPLPKISNQIRILRPKSTVMIYTPAPSILHQKEIEKNQIVKGNTLNTEQNPKQNPLLISMKRNQISALPHRRHLLPTDATAVPASLRVLSSDRATESLSSLLTAQLSLNFWILIVAMTALTTDLSAGRFSLI